MKGPVLWSPLHHGCVLFRTQRIPSATKLTSTAKHTKVMFIHQIDISLVQIMNRELIQPHYLS